jgi:hypothetical protein
MASTPAGSRLTEAHRLAQLGVASDTTALIARSWALLDPTNLDLTSPTWIRAASSVVQQQAARSATLAARYYSTLRLLELGVPLAVEAVLPPAVQIVTALRVTGPVAVKRAMAAGSLLNDAVRSGRAQNVRSASRVALAGGRDTLAHAIESDPDSVGYARVTGGESCPFCSMLASRGFVYMKSSVDFKTHDGCHCTIEPGFR